jgi:hypothetical protein
MRSEAGLWLLALVLSAVGCGDPGPAPALSFAESRIVFPDTVIDHVVPASVRSIALTNTGGESLTLTFALTEETDFTIKSTTCDSLDPGASCDVVVQFAPHTLGARGVDLIATAAGTSVSAALIGVALPEPGLMSVPMSAVDYGEVAIGATKTLRLTVWNGSRVTARPYGVALVGADVEDFAIVADACSGISNVSNGTCTIDVTFAPSVASPRNAQLVVSSANLGSLMIALDGNGYRPAELAVSPGSGMFGSVFELGQSPAQSFIVTNTGTVPSPELQVTLSGTNANYFELTDGCSGTTLPGGGACMFSIVYQARAVGMHAAAATVSAGSLVPVVLPLTGMGEPAQIRISPSGWNFDRVLVGQTSGAKIFTVENTGSTNTGLLAVGLWFPHPGFTFVTDACSGIDLAPGATCNFGVTVTPTARGFSGAALIVSATRGDKIASAVQVEGVIAATLSATPTAVAFGDVQMTENPSQVVTVSNTGDLATGAITVAVVGNDRADVTLVEDCTGRSLQFFDSCSLTVSFSPSHLGAETAAIEITSPGTTVTIPVTANTLRAPEFTVSPDMLVLNPVAVGESYPRTFVVQGTGAVTGPLTVAVTGSNAADYAVTDDDCSGQTLTSGQACTVTLTLTPSATGSRNAVLVVAGQPGGYRNIPVTGIAFTQATLTISRSTIMFAATGVGQTDTAGFVIIRNTGQLPTGTLTAQLVGANPTEFGVIADTCTGAVLAPNAECSVHTEFAPTQIASSTASLVVSSTPGGTVSAVLSGTGLPPPVISSMTTSHDFPPQETFTERSAVFRIDNVGGSPTDRLRASLTGPQANLFTVNDFPCFGIPAGGYCDVDVYFRPTGVGQASATLLVESDLAGSVTIALTATATPGTKIVVSPDSYDFGFVATGGNSAAKSFIATNIGQRDVTMFHTFVPSGCDNFEVVSTTCGATLAPNASCQADVVFHPVSSSFGFCRLVFVEGTLLKGEAELLGRSTP